MLENDDGATSDGPATGAGGAAWAGLGVGCCGGWPAAFPPCPGVPVKPVDLGC